MNIKYCDICKSEADTLYNFTLYNFEKKQVCEHCLTIMTECIMSCDNCHRSIADEALYEYKGNLLCRECLLREAKSDGAFVTKGDDEE